MDSSTITTNAPKKPGLLINRNFALLWTSGTVSVFGDVIFDVTLFVWVAVFLGKGQSWAPLAASGVGLAALVPIFIFGPLAGVFADRWDKRRTMLSMDALRAMLIASLILATNVIPLPFFSDGRVPLAGQLIAMYAVVFLNSLFAQFFNPAKMALIGDIVPSAQQPQASGLAQVTQSIAMLLAPAIAPVLALTFGIEWALLIDALTFVFSFLMILVVQAPIAARSVTTGQKGNVAKEFFQGLSFAVGNKFISTVIVTAGIIMFGVAATNTLDIFFALQNLHVAAQYYGLLSTMLGVGMIIGAILASVLAQRLGLVCTMNLSLLGVSIAILSYSRMSSFVLALVAVFFVGFFQTGLQTVLGPLLLWVTPRAMVGRISGILNPVIAITQILGIIIAGYLASALGPNFHAVLLGIQFGQIDTIFTGGAVIAILGTLYSLARLGFRDPPKIEAPPNSEVPVLETEPILMPME